MCFANLPYVGEQQFLIELYRTGSETGARQGDGYGHADHACGETICLDCQV